MPCVVIYSSQLKEQQGCAGIVLRTISNIKRPSSDLESYSDSGHSCLEQISFTFNSGHKSHFNVKSAPPIPCGGIGLT